MVDELQHKACAAHCVSVSACTAVVQAYPQIGHCAFFVVNAFQLLQLQIALGIQEVPFHQCQVWSKRTQSRVVLFGLRSLCCHQLHVISSVMCAFMLHGASPVLDHAPGADTHAPNLYTCKHDLHSVHLGCCCSPKTWSSVLTLMATATVCPALPSTFGAPPGTAGNDTRAACRAADYHEGHVCKEQCRQHCPDCAAACTAAATTAAATSVSAKWSRAR